MRNLCLAPALLLAVGALGAVESPDLRSNVGIGLGTMLFESMGYTDSVFGQTCAATTNGSFSNQLFFVTTGTGGAKPTSGFVQNRPLRDFVADNLDTLARDMAAGTGESLATLAELAGIAEADRAAFYAKLQANFAEIFPSADVTSEQVVDRLAAITA
ncbi:MAG: DUF3015 family protein [Planctomycetes bacterium]|nr:DUF3015 family protein [Planctomycetota bacterium]